MKCTVAENLLLSIDTTIADIKQYSRKNHSTVTSVDSYLAKYLIIAISGAYQESIKNIIMDYVRLNASSETHSYVTSSLARTENPKSEYIKKVTKSFNHSWHKQLIRLKRQRFNDLDSINNLRNSIAHGVQISITFNDAVRYYRSSRLIIEKMDRLFLGR